VGFCYNDTQETTDRRTGVLQHDFKAAIPAASRLKESRFILQYLISEKCT